MAYERRPGEELTKEQNDAAIAWLQEKRGNHPCPSCGRNDFAVLNSLAGLPVQAVDGPMSLGRSYPCIVLVCTHCAYMMFYNAMTMEIYMGQKSKEKKGEHKEQEESHVQSS